MKILSTVASIALLSAVINPAWAEVPAAVAEVLAQPTCKPFSVSLLSLPDRILAPAVASVGIKNPADFPAILTAAWTTHFLHSAAVYSPDFVPDDMARLSNVVATTRGGKVQLTAQSRGDRRTNAAALRAWLRSMEAQRWSLGAQAQFVAFFACR